MNSVIEACFSDSGMLCQVFNLIAESLGYNIAAVALYWLAALAIVPATIWLLVRKPLPEDSRPSLVIVRGGGQPTEYYNI